MNAKPLLKNLKQALNQLIGVRRYDNSLQSALDKISEIEFTPKEKEALRLLTQNINEKNQDLRRAKNSPKFNRFF